jgi:hypothetical protein
LRKRMSGISMVVFMHPYYHIYGPAPYALFQAANDTGA